jgi:hypothetical protein
MRTAKSFNSCVAAFRRVSHVSLTERKKRLTLEPPAVTQSGCRRSVERTVQRRHDLFGRCPTRFFDFLRVDSMRLSVKPLSEKNVRSPRNRFICLVCRIKNDVRPDQIDAESDGESRLFVGFATGSRLDGIVRLDASARWAEDLRRVTRLSDNGEVVPSADEHRNVMLATGPYSTTE